MQASFTLIKFDVKTYFGNLTKMRKRSRKGVEEQDEMLRGNYDFTWCPICENQVSEKYKDTVKLLDHIRTMHPPLTDEQYENMKKEFRCHVIKKIAKKCKLFARGSKSSTKISRRKIDEKFMENFYRPKISCPICNVQVVPIELAGSSSKFRNCQFGAACLSGCWPLCFIPLMISRDKTSRMVCPLCGYDYGTYNVRNFRENAIIAEDVQETLGKPEMQTRASTTSTYHREIDANSENYHNPNNDTDDANNTGKFLS